MLKNYHKEVTALVDALQYAARFKDKIVLIKCGGSILDEIANIKSFAEDIALLQHVGMRIILLHGGGKEITNMCKKLNMKVEFHNGYRVTDSDTIDVVSMTMLGKTNNMLVNAINKFGVKAVGICGTDAHFLKAKKLNCANSDMDLGYVGEITEIDTNLIETLLNAEYLPVIAASLAIGENSQIYNTNADDAACCLAAKLKAEKLIILSDVNGIYKDIKNPETKISSIKKCDLEKLLDNKILKDGMIPKVRSCLKALENGVHTVQIIDGRNHGLILEIFTKSGMGTIVEN